MAKEKFKSADDVAAEYMELQLSKSRESRFENILVTVLTVGFVFIFAIAFWLLPDRDFSEEENRTLQAFPEFELEGFLHGDFTADFGTYMADQFPLRNFFIGVKAISETAQLKGQNNDVILGADGYLIARSDYPDEGILSQNIENAGKFISVAEENGIDCTAAFAGRKMDVLEDKLPALYGSYYSDRIFGILDGMCEQNGFDYVNLRDALIAADKEGLYYKTDHHWTSLGAYYAYCEIVESMGITPYALSDFEIEAASDDFFGTTWSSAGVKWTEGDTIEYFRWEGDENLTLRIKNSSYDYKKSEKIEENGVKYDVFETVYVREMLEKKDKYASFAGGNNNSYVEITMEGENIKERETLVLLRDSFADSLAPFLARHFDLVLIDLRTSTPDTIAIAKELGAERILLLYNMETLTTTNDLKNLNFKLSSHKIQK
ncbi:MAG: hypothetical protein E7647_05160 [Ruminococcaceae bacterium]|nr:hypothetical protein [Oscillospiraceae bacterium]